MQGSVLFVAAALVACALGAPNDGRVLGGTNADDGEFPHMVSLRRSPSSHFCGGSIISTTVILTAAHCVIGTNAASIHVITGSNTLNAGGNRHNVASIVTHADYNPDDSWMNDVAILRLETAITLSPVEQIIALPAQDESSGDATSSPSRVSGWGYTRYPGFVLPNDLQKLDLALVPLATCRAGHDITIHDSQICAGTISGQGVCNGDSGGPLLADGKQVGIVSWGRSCATGVADVYTRVASYRSWIDSKSQ